MGDRLLLDPDLAESLRAAGVRSAADVFALGGPLDARSVGTFVERPVEGTIGRFYYKRYAYEGWRRSWGLVGRGTLWGTPPEVNEFRALQWLRAAGLPAVRPIAAAARTRGGRLVAHALLTEAVPDAPDLDARLHTDGDALRSSRRLRRAVAEALGALLARMHALGFRHRDCHARNVLVGLEGGEPALWLLDCRRGGVGGRGGPDHDLACLDRDLRGVLTRGERRRALAAYLGPSGDAKEAVRRIAALREALPPPRRR